MRIALAQILSTNDPATNLQTLTEQVEQAAAAGAGLVLFPEATMCRFGIPLGPVAQPLDGPWADGVRSVAARNRITVVAGMFTPAGDGRVTNTLLVAGADGGDGHYHKIHLYDAFGFRESRTVAPGTDPTIITVDGIDVGLTTCYDIRFPALYTELADRGAQLIAVCASWGAGPGKLQQWEVLARARALDSTSYIAAVGQAAPAGGPQPEGRGSPPTGIGHSMVVSPMGAVLAAAEAEPQLLTVDIDLLAVDTARQTLAVLANRADFARGDALIAHR